MSKYVDIEKILNDKGYATRFPNTSDLYYHESILQYAPVEDVAPVIHAHWKQDKTPHRCSSCEGVRPYEVNEFCPDKLDYWTCPHCPRCGAKMDEEDIKHD